jgi:hypothetical protein
MWTVLAQSLPNVDDMHARKWDFIMEKISLNTDQVSKVKPIFLEYEKADWMLMEENHKTFKKLQYNKETNKKVNYEEVNDQYVEMEMRKSVLLKNYYAKLKKVLPAETIHGYFRAERSFRRDLLKNIDENRRMKRAKM